MMVAWSFSAKTLDDLARLLRTLGKHRYVQEVDHRIHWSIDAALSAHAPFDAHARAFTERRRQDRSLDPSSYDPSLWRSAPVEDVIAALKLFWGTTPEAHAAGLKLRTLLEHEGLTIPKRPPFEGDAESPDHPQLIQLSWRLYAICDLDPDRHAGAIAAMEAAEEEVDPSSPVDHEGPDLGVLELTEGAVEGALPCDFLVWADGPRSYSDYVFRGAYKMSKLPGAPEGPDD